MHSDSLHCSAGFPSSKDVSFAEVSCVDGNGMKQLRNKLKELIDKWVIIPCDIILHHCYN